jgi:hypothetical protein
MDISVMKQMFGTEQVWQGPCTVILDAQASVQVAGQDALATGGIKAWAPRTISGRIAADAVCLLRDCSALVLLQQLRSKTATGEEVVKYTLTVANPPRVVAVEFTENVPHALSLIGLALPVVKTSGSHSGLHAKPKLMG